jgi:hypothetical protein
VLLSRKVDTANPLGHRLVSEPADGRSVAEMGGKDSQVDADARKVVGVCPVQPLKARVKAL